MERQNHGFREEEYLFGEYPIIKDPAYTSKWDGIISSEDVVTNRELGTSKNIPVSIKTKKIGSAVELGSLKRIAAIEDDFILNVAFWAKDKNNIVQRHSILVPGFEWQSNFIDHYELVQKMTSIFKDNDISNSREDDLKWRKVSKDYRDEWESMIPNFNVLFKRDHKTQKRVQSSIKPVYLNILIEEYSCEFVRR